MYKIEKLVEEVRLLILCKEECLSLHRDSKKLILMPGITAWTEFQSPLITLWMEHGRTMPLFPAEDEMPMLFCIRAEEDAGQKIC